MRLYRVDNADTVQLSAKEWNKIVDQNAALLAALKELVARCDGAEGVRADGSNIQTMAAHAALEKAEGAKW